MGRLVAALVVVVGIVSQANAQTSEATGDREAQAREEFERARALAESGNSFSQQLLSAYYESGYGVSKDEFMAVFWLRRAAEQGNASSRARLGYRYEHGEGVPRDIQKAIYWYRLATQPLDPTEYREPTGYFDPISAHQLGLINLEGKGIKRDVSAAYWWFRKAAEAGYFEAQFVLGQMYENGDGVRKDLDKAIHWYREAVRWAPEIVGAEQEKAKEALERLGQ